MSDVLGSAAAIAAAGIILALGWVVADPLLSIAVSMLILRSGWQLTRDSAHVLLEGTPTHFDAAARRKGSEGITRRRDIHHLHAWSMTGEAPIVTLHAQLFEDADRQRTLAVILERLGSASAWNTRRCRSKKAIAPRRTTTATRCDLGVARTGR